MGYNQANYTRIRKEYETKYLRAREDADRRRAEALRAIPELADIDRALGQTGLMILGAALAGEDPDASIQAVRSQNETLQKQKRALLLAGGFPADYTDIRYECPICQDEGFHDFKICSCMKKKLVEAAYESSGMAELLATQSFENFDLTYYADDPQTATHMKRVYDLCRAYARDFDPAACTNLLFMGGTGLGKTHLSTAIARQVIDAGHDVFYTTAANLISDFEIQKFGHSTGGETGLGTTQYFDCDLLIVDDLGTEMGGQFTTSALYGLINDRILAGKATIISTNLTAEDMEKKYSPQILSRLRGTYKRVAFVGDDIRLLKNRGIGR